MSMKAKAIGMYIFSGSQTIGHLETGWDVDRVLEMTDDMDETNAYHFVRNYDIPIIKPSEWNNDNYINSLKNKYDLLFANPPCSGLSSINRNANVNNNINKHIYEVIEVIDKIKPKTFLIENAPTLISKGLPILKDMSNKLFNNYKITIITDLAGNHNVPMYRKRTLIVGWRKDEFKGIPKINCIVNNSFTVGDALLGLNSDSLNMTPVNINDQYDFSRFYNLVEPGEPVVKSLCRNLDKIRNQLSENELKLIERIKPKYDKGGSVWDKSPLRLDSNSKAPSITSVNRYIHPSENRDIYIREYARLMGYPDSYKFYEGSKVSEIQCIAQGVPVNFIKYISSEILNQLNNKVYFDKDCDIMYINQSSGVQKIVTFSNDEFQDCDIISINNKNNEVNLWWN